MANNIELNVEAIHDAMTSAIERLNTNQAELLEQYSSIKNQLLLAEGETAEAVRTLLDEESSMAEQVVIVLKDLCNAITFAADEFSIIDGDMSAIVSDGIIESTK